MIRAALFVPALFAAVPAVAGDWVAAWTAAPFPATPVLTAQDVRDVGGATVRQDVTVNAGGRRIRVRMTNALGTEPLSFLTAAVALNGRAFPLRFGGQAGTTIPVGASLVSDPLPVAIRAFQPIAITVRYGPDSTPAAHLLTVTVQAPGRSARTGRGPALAAGVEVDRPGGGHVLVALGDSITEGARVKPQSFTGWPELFARRLATLPRFRDWSVVNAGIHGNRLLRDGAGPSALARFDRDVLAVPGASAVLLLEGINDLGWGYAKPDTDGPASAGDVIAAYRQIIDRAHASGLRVIGATILPYRGSVYFTPPGEAARQAVNRWVRTAHAFDAMIDFDALLRDRQNPTQLGAVNDAGDHLHPSDAGYAAMARAIDPALLIEGR